MLHRNQSSIQAFATIVAICFATYQPSLADEKPMDDVTLKAHRELAKFPKLSGTLKQLLGHEGGYVRPKPGEPFQLDLKEVAKLDVSRRLDFDLKEKSYIPLPGPISVQEIHRYSNGAFSAMRLVSKESARRGVSVTIDIIPAPGAGKGPNFVTVWIVCESHDLMRGVALLECYADGDFPDAPK